MFHDSEENTFKISWPGYGPFQGGETFGFNWAGQSEWLRQGVPGADSPYIVTLSGDKFVLHFFDLWPDLSLIYQPEAESLPFSLDPGGDPSWTFDASSGQFSVEGTAGGLSFEWTTPTQGGLLIVGTIDLGSER